MKTIRLFRQWREKVDEARRQDKTRELGHPSWVWPEAEQAWDELIGHVGIVMTAIVLPVAGFLLTWCTRRW
jgi:hypothetical protein